MEGETDDENKNDESNSTSDKSEETDSSYVPELVNTIPDMSIIVEPVLVGVIMTDIEQADVVINIAVIDPIQVDVVITDMDQPDVVINNASVKSSHKATNANILKRNSAERYDLLLDEDLTGLTRKNVNF